MKKEEYSEPIVKCRTCKKQLHGKNAIDVGYCLDCYNEMMADDEDDGPDLNYYFHEGRGQNNDLL